MSFDIQSMLQSQQKAVESLIQTRNSENERSVDPLTKLAQTRGQDKVKLTYYFLRKNLAEGLEETIAQAENKYPDAKGKFFLGIVSDESPRVEVVSLEKASQSVTDVPPEEALKHMQETRFGYFQGGDFTMKTPDDPSLQGIRKEVQAFLDKSKSIFAFLRDHPEANVTLDDLRPKK